MTRDCMFQYATHQRVLADTDLITKDEAVNLFNKNKEDFLKRLENDENPEMVIWIDCATSESYGESLHYWNAEDLKVFEGELYKKV